MNVGIFATYSESNCNSGVGKYTCNLIKYLGVFSSHNFFIFTHADFRIKSINKFKNIHFIPINFNFSKNIFTRSVFYVWLNLYTVFMIRRLRLDVTLDLAQSFRFLYHRSPLITVIHDVAELMGCQRMSFLQTQLRKCAYFLSFNISSHIIAVSGYTQKTVANFSNVPSTLIYHGVSRSPDKYLLLKNKSIPKEKELILFDSGYHHKNLNRTMSALIKLKDLGVEFKLKVVGSEKERILGGSEIFKNLDWIEFLGKVSENKLNFLYQNAALLLYPSLYEGFGLPILEAMSCGCPVVTSNVTSMPEVAGGAAHLVDPYDVEDIARGVEKVLSDDEYRDELIIKGYTRAAQFSWEDTARKTVEVLERVAKEHRKE